MCVAPPGCLLSSSPDGPTKGFFYVPSEKGTSGEAIAGSGGLGPTPNTTVTAPAGPRARLSATFGFNPCVNTGCGKPAVRPLVDTGAMVFVVFGIVGLNRTRQVDNHVIGDPVRGPTLSRCQLTDLQISASQRATLQAPHVPTSDHTGPPRAPGSHFS